MPTYSIDLTEIAAILVGGALLMIPVLGLTLRWTVPAILDAIDRAREKRLAAAGWTAAERANGSDAPRSPEARVAVRGASDRQFASLEA